MSLQLEIDALCEAANRLLRLGLDGFPIYTDSFRELNADVYRQSETLFRKTASSDIEEAALCKALLMGYSATIYNHGDKDKKIQLVLDCSWNVLDRLPASLLKCQLLVACYAEVPEEELAKEAHAIIDSWNGKELTLEESEVIERLQLLEED